MIANSEHCTSKSILIYSDQCRFCTDTAHWLLNWIGKDKLRLVANSNWRYEICHEVDPGLVKKDVHAILYFYKGTKYRVYSKGGDCIATISLKTGLGWVKYLYDVPLFDKAIDLVYNIVKKYKTRWEK